MANIDVALALAEAGIYVFPVPAQKDVGFYVAWSKRSTTALGTIGWWWRKWPDALVGIDLRKSELLVLDGDQHPDKDGVIENDGVEALRNLFADRGYSLHDHPVTRTPRNGVHIFFSNPDNSVGCPRKVMPAGVDVKGAGGLIIAPGSVRGDGIYRALTGHPSLLDAAPPDPPRWLMGILKPPKPALQAPSVETGLGTRPVRQPHMPGRGRAWAAAALDGIARQLAGMAPETGRNQFLNDQAFRLGTMVHRGWLDRGTVERALSAAAAACNCPGWQSTMRSGLNAGVQIPHHELGPRK